MTAIAFRMSAGFPGDVTRTHPCSVMPRMNDATSPVAAVGLACVFNGSNNDVRGMASGDTAVTVLAGVVVRPFPFQQVTAPTGSFGSAGYSSGANTAPPPQVIDVLQSGSIIVPCVGTPNLGGTAYVWVAATTTGHIQGGFEASSSSGNTATLSYAYFNGPGDSNGNAELIINVP